MRYLEKLRMGFTLVEMLIMLGTIVVIWGVIKATLNASACAGV